MDELTEPFGRLLEQSCPFDVVRSIEAGGDWHMLWRTIADSGFLDALVDEEAGGAGLDMLDVAPLIELAGAHAAPLPIGDTMVARALLSRSGITAPYGPIVLSSGKGLTAPTEVAQYALTGTLEVPRLQSLASSDTACDVDGSDAVASKGIRALAALVRALSIAGGANRVLQMAVEYANARTQFGKPIGRQQAVQQQLALLAEQAVAARIAAHIGARGGLGLDCFTAGVAKYGASIAAVQVAQIAHAVFGAIGISAEHDLQLLTRRLHAWRIAEGAESFWAERCGVAQLSPALKPAVAGRP